MAQGRNLNVTKLLEGYLAKSKALDKELDQIEEALTAVNEPVQQREELNDQLDWIAAEKQEKLELIDALKADFQEYTFAQNDEGIAEVHDRRKALLADLEDLAAKESNLRDQLDNNVIDTVAIANLAATVKAGVTIPNHDDLLKALEYELQNLRNQQSARLKQLQSALPERLADKQTYDAAMKKLDPFYRTAEQRAEQAKRLRDQRQEELRRFNQQPKSSDEIKKQKDRNLAIATSAPVPAHEW